MPRPPAPGSQPPTATPVPASLTPSPTPEIQKVVSIALRVRGSTKVSPEVEAGTTAVLLPVGAWATDGWITLEGELNWDYQRDAAAGAVRYLSGVKGITNLLTVKPGITGWAQVNGWRGDTSIRERLAHDLYYLRNWGIGLDIKILLWTVTKSFFHPNAY